MNTVIEFIQDNDIMIMIALLILIIILTIIVIITDIINKNKRIKDSEILFNNENQDVINAFNEELYEEKPLDYTIDLGQYAGILDLNEINNNKNSDLQEIKYVEEDEELEKTKAQIELKALKEELIKAEEKEKEQQLKALNENNNIIENNNINIQNQNEEIIDIEKSPINKFEFEQEENAIISIEQFNKISDKKYDENELIQYEDEGNEPISIKELEELYNTKELKAINTNEKLSEYINDISPVKNESVYKENVEDKIDVIKQNIETVKEIDNTIEIIDVVPQKFKSSPIISPVYGIDESVEQNVEAMKLENTANLEKLNEEIKKTNEFLNTLKELRKNLQ